MLTDLHHRIIWGDARRMHDLTDASVQLIVTSPPYWQLKDYGSAHQIGFNDDYAAYIAGLNKVWSECNRVLSPGCRLCVNIGDQFARAAHYGRYKVIPIREHIVRACEELGMDYMGAVIWRKATTMNASGGGAVMGSFPYPRNGILKIDYEFILLFKKLGKSPPVTPEQKAASAMTTEEWNEYFSGHWNFAGERQGDGHIAMFPLELPRRLIKMFSFVGETVLDPFAGSGTTLVAAMQLERRGIGYEINPDFEPTMRKRLALKPTLRGAPQVEFVHSNAVVNATDLAGSGQTKESGSALQPDSTLQRQVDPKHYRFGSVVEVADVAKSKDRGMRVREILAPNRLRLEDGGEVVLLGVLPHPQHEAEAQDYLRAMLLSKPVFLKFDAQVPAADGVLSAYVYLENKTFINAKLIKYGWATAAQNVAHRHARRFREYEQELSATALEVSHI